MAISFSKKSKCQGCKALVATNTSYSCSLGFTLTFDTGTDGKPWKPKPGEKCYKPISTEQLREAKKKLKEKTTKSEA